MRRAGGSCCVRQFWSGWRTARLLAIGFALGLLGFGLSPGSASAETVLRFSSQGDALTLDPHAQAEGPTIRMLGQIYETLVGRDPALRLEPALAVSWRLIDPTTWEFELRRNVTFHNGAAFTAEDVVFSLARAQSETSNFRSRLQSILRAEAVDDFTLRLITDGPNPILPNQLTSFFIMDSGWAAEHGVERPQDYSAGEETYAVRHANGTGPFILEHRAAEEETRLRRNDQWWGLESYPHNLDRLVFRPIANAATRTAALLSGELDLTLDLPLQDIDRVKQTEGYKVQTASQDRTIFFGLNQASDTLRAPGTAGRNPLKDPRVRRAMLLAIDADAIRDSVMRGLSDPAGIIAAPVVAGHSEELDTRPAVDLEAARGLLAKAGYPNGFQITLNCPNDRYVNDERICTAVAAMLAKIAIEVRLEALPKAQHFPKVAKRQVDFYMLGWGSSTLDSHDTFRYLVHSEGPWNATGYAEPEVDRLIEAIGTEVDEKARAEMVEEVWQRIKKDVVYLPLHHQVIAWGMSERVEIPVVANNSPRFAWARME